MERRGNHQFDPSRIVSLHNHGSFSVLDGLSRYEDIVGLAVERGQVAAAITEHGNISGFAEFYHKCKDAGIKPLLGEEFYIVPEGRRLTDRNPEKDRKRHHITILAKNDEGYKNLCYLSSVAKIKGDYYKPRIDYEELFTHKNGLIVLSGCIVSQLNYYIESYLGNNGEKDEKGYEKARKYVQMMKRELGDDFYIEQVWLRPTGVTNWVDKSKAETRGMEYLSIIDRQNAANELTTRLAKEFGIKRVMTADAHYARPEDKESHETLICIGTASDKTDPNRLTFIDQDLSIPSAEAMYNHAKELNDFELVETQGEIIDKITLDLKLGEQGYRIPKFPIPKGKYLGGKEVTTEAEYLRYLTFEGYKKKNYAEIWKDKLDEVLAEIRKELKVIDQMGFNGYFLIVQEYINWAKANGVLVGPGRGSAAGSVVAYLIGITNIDPMEYPELMIFERFLNPSRYCFLPGQNVSLKRTARCKIENVRPGDYAKTFDLSFQKVLKRIEIPVIDEDCVEISFNNGQKIKCTANHRIYEKNKGWVEAQELQKGDICMSPKLGNDKIQVSCQMCGKRFVKGAQLFAEAPSDKNFYCKECSYKIQGEKIRGKNNPGYKYWKSLSSKEKEARIQNQVKKMKETYAKDPSICRNRSLKAWNKNIRRRKALSIRNRVRLLEKDPGMMKWLEKGNSYVGNYSIFHSEKLHKDIPCRSNLEKRVCELLEVDSSVKRFGLSKERIPYIKKGETHIYIPDFDVEYKDGRKVVFEVKPEIRVQDEINQLKFAAAKKKLGKNFLVVTESYIKNHNDNLHNEVKVLSVKHFRYTGIVYDLHIENNHNYVVNKIHVHNSMPDIDTDFSDRQKVEDHLVELYGRENVCAIQTITRMRAKQVFKDVARTEKYDYMESNRVAALIPDLAGEDAKKNRLENEMEHNDDLKEKIGSDENLYRIFKEAVPLEGTVRGFGVHAAGVIISDAPLTNYIGLFVSKDKRLVQQSDATQVEPDYGLLKMDLLGLANLTVMDECIKSINKRYGHTLDTPDDIPIDDEKTYKLIANGESKFTFQFNSPLMRNAAKRLQPKNLKDLALLVAVVRPGPLQFLDEIIDSKNGAKRAETKTKIYPKESKKTVTYHPIELTEPKIKNIVDSTYGHVVYQEQLMRICTDCCGFTMGEADKVRKAMGKSRPSELKKYRPNFIKGFLEHTDPTKELEISIFWDELLELARYCFAGDTVIQVPNCRPNQHKYTIEERYNILYSKEKLSYKEMNMKRAMEKKFKEKGYYFKCLSLDNDNRIRTNEIVDIMYKGIQSIFRLTLENGMTIDCTEDHRIYTLDGIKKLRDLRPYDLVFCKGEYEKTDGKAFNQNRFKKLFTKNLPKKGEKGFQKVKKPKEKNYRFYSYLCKKGHCSCDICGEKYSDKKRFELHHIDGDHNNDERDNFLWLCNSCHKKEDYKIGRRKQYEKGILSTVSKVKNIEFLREDKVYDVTAKSPSHNVVVNDGIVAHQCFNGSHSVCYSTIGYQTAYLLAHYPEEYLAAYMNIKKDNKDEIDEVISYAREKGIEVSTPDVRVSGLNFTPDEGRIVYGLSAIKGVGISASKIIEVMSSENPPKTVEEFLTAFDKKSLNSRVLSALVYSGALDGLVTKEEAERQEGFKNYAPRFLLINNLDNMIHFRDEFFKNQKRKVPKEQPSLFADLFEDKKDKLILGPNNVIDTKKRKKEELTKMLLKEKEYIGSFITYDPLRLYSPTYEGDLRKDYEETYKRMLEIGFKQDGSRKRSKMNYSERTFHGLVARVSSRRQVVTKNGDVMYFLQAELCAKKGDILTVDLTVFPDLAREIKGVIREANFYDVDVVLEGENAFFAQRMRPL